MAVIQVMLLGSEDRYGSARLLAWIGLLLRNERSDGDNTERKHSNGLNPHAAIVVPCYLTPPAGIVLGIGDRELGIGAQKLVISD